MSARNSPLVLHSCSVHRSLHIYTLSHRLPFVCRTLPTTPRLSPSGLATRLASHSHVSGATGSTPMLPRGAGSPSSWYSDGVGRWCVHRTHTHISSVIMLPYYIPPGTRRASEAKCADSVDHGNITIKDAFDLVVDITQNVNCICQYCSQSLTAGTVI
jgi:hypothetical protein